jgi:hypothetical protein
MEIVKDSKDCQQKAVAVMMIGNDDRDSGISNNEDSSTVLDRILLTMLGWRGEFYNSKSSGYNLIRLD